MLRTAGQVEKPVDRRGFIGGSDVRIIMGDDATALLRLWREKRGEIEPEDLTNNLIVQLGTVTEHLNRHWYERNTGQVVTKGAAPGVSSGQAMDGGNAGRHG
jgi:predicted phage-related endonuclease